MANYSDICSGMQELSVEKDSPSWLKALEGDDPVVSPKQFSFINEIRSKIRNRKKNSPGSMSVAEVQELRQNAHIMQTNFEQLVQQVRISRPSRDRFVEKYPTWSDFRRKNVTNLNGVADTIDQHVANCKVGKVTGSLVSLVGGGLCLAAGGNSQMVGSLMMGLGSLTSAGTSGVEAILLRENINKAKGIIHLDKTCMEDLLAFVRGSERLHKAIDNIQSVDYDESVLAAAEKFQDIAEKDLSTEEKMKEINQALKSFKFSPEVAEEISNVIGILVGMSMIFKRYYYLFKLAVNGYNLVSRLRLTMDLLRGAYNGFQAVSGISTEGRLTSSQKTQIKCSMALDFANILLVALEDSKSVEGREIRNVARQLEREADEFEGFYQDVKGLKF